MFPLTIEARYRILLGGGTKSTVGDYIRINCLLKKNIKTKYFFRILLESSEFQSILQPSMSKMDDNGSTK